MPERGKLTNNILIKYRPAVLDDLLGNQRAKTAVRNMVRNGLLAAPEIRVNLAATSVGRDLGQASASAVAS